MKLLKQLFSVLTIFFLLLLSGCMHIPKEVKYPVKFPDKEYHLYAKDISGVSYGWKIACCIPAATPKYTEAINEIWKKSQIPMSERKHYTLVNIKQRYGVEWSILFVGQNYLSVSADIAKFAK